MPTGNGTYSKLSTPSPWMSVVKRLSLCEKKLCFLPKAEILCPLSVLERVRIIEGFLEEMYENFVGT